mgnify:CR=1 FL=1
MRVISILFTLFVSIGCEADRSITVQEANEYLGNEDILFLDVRDRQEFENEGRIKNAFLIPVNVLEGRLTELEQHREKKIIIYCRSGRRSQIATDILIKNNFNAFNMDGGFLAWEEYSHP